MGSSSRQRPGAQGNMGGGMSRPINSTGSLGGMFNGAQYQANPQPQVSTQMPMPAPPMVGNQRPSPAPPMVGNQRPSPAMGTGFMPMGFGQMPQRPQMPTFGGPRGGKAPQ